LLGFFRRHYATHTRGVVAAALATAAAAMAEASALVMIVPLAERATRTGDEVMGRIGPVEIDLGTGQLLGLVLALITFSTLAKVLSLWLRSRTVRSWERRERVRALRSLLSADYEHTARLSPAELQALVGSHVAQAAQGLSIIAMVTNAAISFAILVLVAFSTAPLAALVIAVVGGSLLALLRPLARRTRQAGKVSSAEGLETARLVSDTARDGREIRLHGAQDHFLAHYTEAVTRHAATQRRLNMISGLGPILYQGFGLLLVVLALALALNVGDLEVTTLGAVALLFLRSLGYGQQLSTTQQQYNQMVPFVERLDAELGALRDAEERFGDTHLDRVTTIELREVSYRYPGTEDDQDALRAVSLELRPPGTVGLIGPSGSGKSTLAQLLLRLRHPTEGRLLVNGEAIDTFTRESWTRQVALVPQYPQLTRGSVRDNITFFRPDLTDDDVRRVAEAVGLDTLFESLPDGYDTELGETSRELSGGQLQRIGIARALAGRPSLLVLDEPTSALDAETEKWVQRALTAASKEALVIVITHRATTLAACDRVIRLAEGRVVADDAVPPRQAGSGEGSEPAVSRTPQR
jgi:ATP-binding cassette, subfamily B, bacterial